ncbi:MAG: LysM peptidoglycan-binding domain-containing protein [Anaerolineales bacterium]|nr:LysM peptidoglycan-binding domain-containing protein [Anaerolineales bacterium]
MLLMLFVRWFQKDVSSGDEREIPLVRFMPRDNPRGRQQRIGNLTESSERQGPLFPNLTEYLKAWSLRFAITGGLVTGTLILSLLGSVTGLGLAFDEATVSYARSGTRTFVGSDVETTLSTGFEDVEELFKVARSDPIPSSSLTSSIDSPGKVSTSMQAPNEHSKHVIQSSHELPTPFPSEPFYEPAGCKEPTGGKVELQGEQWHIDSRTLWMLSQAAELFDAELDLTELALEKESLLSGFISLRLGIDGNALTIPMTRPGSRHVLYDEVDPLVTALRVAGFAAWFRDAEKPEEIHIYAIPIGDPNLSREEAALVEGEFGYFKGYGGIVNGEPQKDPHGGPIVCQWMVDAGYEIDQSRANGGRVGSPTGDWRERLRVAAQRYITTSDRQTFTLAKQLGYLGGLYEDPSNMCGPLTASILLEADLIPASVGPLRNPKSFWLANPALNGRPWSFFSLEEYELFSSPMRLDFFDFGDRPLCPGDTVFTYAGNGEFSHVFVVTEVDAQGRAYSVTNYSQKDGSFLVERLMLYDPTNPDVGVFNAEWSNDVVRGRTGLGGFEVLRRRGTCMPPGSPLDYAVRPGDTYANLAARFNTSVAEIFHENQISDETYKLEVGQRIWIPANTLDLHNSMETETWLHEGANECEDLLGVGCFKQP